MYLDIHITHTLPYGNPNRDENGEPKTAQFGGAKRARVSSQAWKRPVRGTVEDLIGEHTYRTRHIATGVADKLTTNHQWDHDTARKAGRAVMAAADAGATRKDTKPGGLLPNTEDHSDVLFWIPTAALDELAELCLPHHDTIADTALPATEHDNNGKKGKTKNTKPPVILDTAAVDNCLKRRSPTINLLGRFLAELPDHKITGAVSFAHAIGTHETDDQTDFFTAVDDISGDSGAGHMAVDHYAATTFYRYTTVNLTDFATNLGSTIDETLPHVDAFLRACTTSLPIGKQHTTATHTPPDLVHVALRNQPRNLALAFEEPVYRTRHGGYAEPSAAKLDHTAGRLDTFMNTPAAWSGYSSHLTTNRTHLGDRFDSVDTLTQAAINAALDHTETGDTA